MMLMLCPITPALKGYPMIMSTLVVADRRGVVLSNFRGNVTVPCGGKILVNGTGQHLTEDGKVLNIPKSVKEALMTTQRIYAKA